MSYIGTTEIGKMFLGSVEIDKAYLGNDLVFDSESSPSPPGVVFYNKLAFDGTAYIDTSYSLPTGCSIRVTLGNETTKSQQRVFLVGNSSEGYYGMYYGGDTNSTKRQFILIYDSTGVISSNRYLNFTTTTYDFFMTSKRFGYSNTSYTYTKGNKHPSSGLVFGCNTNHNGNHYTGTMGIFYVYDSTTQNVTSYSGFGSYTPIATFRPCTYNGVAGMWHVEGNTFYGNSSGAGTLTASN